MQCVCRSEGNDHEDSIQTHLKLSYLENQPSFGGKLALLANCELVCPVSWTLGLSPGDFDSGLRQLRPPFHGLGFT